MAVSRKTNDKMQLGTNLNRLAGLVERIEAKKSKSDDARSDLGTLFKEAEDLGFNRPALKLAIKLRSMEIEKRNDFLVSLNEYCRKLGVWAQGDLFEEAPNSVGPDPATTLTDVERDTENADAIHRRAGAWAGKAGKNADTNPYADGTNAHDKWHAGWMDGQAALVEVQHGEGEPAKPGRARSRRRDSDTDLADQQPAGAA